MSDKKELFGYENKEELVKQITINNMLISDINNSLIENYYKESGNALDLQKIVDISLSKYANLYPKEKLPEIRELLLDYLVKIKDSKIRIIEDLEPVAKKNSYLVLRALTKYLFNKRLRVASAIVSRSAEELNENIIKVLGENTQ